MRGRLLLGWVIIVAFGVGSVLAALALNQRAQDKFESQQQNLASQVAGQTQANLDLSVGQLATEAAFFQASSKVTNREYQVFAKPVLATTAISATVFVDHVPHAERPAFEAGPRPQILETEGDGFEPAGPQPEYFPIAFAAADPGRPVPVVGVDVSSDPVQRKTLARARASGKAAITPVQTVRGLGARGMVVYQPIDDRTAPGKDELIGFAVGFFRDKDLAKIALSATPSDDQLQLLENGVPVIGQATPIAGGAAAPITVADKTWTLVVADPNAPSAVVPIVIGVSGLALAAMLGVLLFTWNRRERYALAMVDKRIAERDAAEAERRRSAQQYRLLAENATDMISVQDGAGHLLYASPSVEVVLGWTPEQLVRTGALDLIHPDDRTDALRRFAKLAENGATVTHQFRCRRRDDTYLWVESTARSLLNDSGQLEIHAATRDIRKRKAMEQELERLAHEDPLTELVNRRRFEQELESELARTRRDGGVGSLIMFDLDRFKEVNDTYGHAAGDAFLVEVAGLLRERLREADVIARLGGDEFAVILHGSGEQEGRLTGEAIAKAIREHSFEASEGTHATASIGVALFNDDPRIDPETLMAEADIAMYAAKRDGRDRVRVYDLDRDATHGGRASEETRPPLDAD